MDDGVSTSPAPDLTRRGGAGPEGLRDRTDVYTVSVGDVLTDVSPEPPVGTEVELGDGERWKRAQDAASAVEDDAPLTLAEYKSALGYWERAASEAQAAGNQNAIAYRTQGAEALRETIRRLEGEQGGAS